MKPRDRVIADLVAKGLTQQQVAELTGTSVRTVQRTVADPVVAAEIERLESEGAVDEPAVATLRAALLAEKRAGVPDWTARIAAARILLSNPSEAAPEPRVITVYAPPAPTSDDA
jgi:transcriptional regulator with XRE-family HTH domain